MDLNFIFYPNICPFLLLKYNKIADKHFSYSETLYVIEKQRFCWSTCQVVYNTSIITSKEISLTVIKDGKPLDLENLPEGLSALNLVGYNMTLDGFPVHVWNNYGKVAFEWRGIQSELEWRDPAGVLLEALTSLSEAIS